VRSAARSRIESVPYNPFRPRKGWQQCPFRFLRRNRNGDDTGTFTTAAPDWRVGDVYMHRPGDYFRILEMEEPPDDDGAHGVWTIESVDAGAN
jgi:hypothetical protein